MNRLTAAFATSAALGLAIPSAHAGPCSTAIAQFEMAVRQSAGNPNAGPLARQTVGAQISHEPTPGSIKRAQARARAAFDAALARAKRLDARDDPRCTDALARAKDMYQRP